VSARFASTNSEALAAAKSALSEWLSSNESRLAEDLGVAPHIVAVADDRIDVVFEGRPDSLRWKDWMVALTQRLSAVPGLTFECFYDLVADAPHPASKPSP